MKKAIKRFFLKILLLFIVLGIIGTLSGILINSRVVSTTEDNILYVVRDDVEIKQFARKSLKNLKETLNLCLNVKHGAYAYPKLFIFNFSAFYCSLDILVPMVSSKSR